MIGIDNINGTNIEDNVNSMINFMINQISVTCTDPIQERCDYESKDMTSIYQNIKSNMGILKTVHQSIIDAIAKMIDYLYRTTTGQGDMFGDRYCSSLNFNYITSVIGLGIFLILSYLLIEFVARIIGNNKYQALARKEIADILILLPLLIALLYLPCMIHIDNISIHQRSLLYIHSAIFSSFVSIIPLTYYAGTVAAHSVSVVQNLGGGAPQTAPLASQYYESALALTRQATTFLALSFVWVNTFTYLYDIFTYGFVRYLLPIAIILRFIPFTRSLGGGLLGLIVASNLFIPIIFSINYEIIKMFGPAYFHMDNNKVTLKFNPWIEMVLSVFASVFILALIVNLTMALRFFGNIKHAISRFRIWQTIRQGFRRLLGSVIGIGGGVSTTSISIFASISSVTTTSIRLFAFQIPLLILIAILIVSVIIFNILLPTITFLFLTSTIKYLSAIFGEEFDLANLTRLV